MIALSDSSKILLTAAASLVSGVIGGVVLERVKSSGEVKTSVQKGQQEALIALNARLSDLDALVFLLDPPNVTKDQVKAVTENVSELEKRWFGDWRDRVVDKDVVAGFYRTAAEGSSVEAHYKIAEKFGWNEHGREEVTSAVDRLREDVSRLRRDLEHKTRA